MVEQHKPGTRTRPVRSAAQGTEGLHGWSDPEYLAALGEEAGAAGLEQLRSLRPLEWLRRLPGRETFAWPGRPGWIVKRTVGGEAKDYWFERLRGQPRCPARRELENLLLLAQAGVPVPRGLAWFGEPRAAGHPLRGAESALVMERVEHRGSLRDVLRAAPGEERQRLLAELLELVVGLHAQGWIHRDLYLQHLVVGERGLVLLDVGRARQRVAPRERWFVKDLAALDFSSPAELGRTLRLRFLRGWLEARGVLGAIERRHWVRRIRRRGRRMAQHRPKHLDAGDPVDAELFP